MMRHIRGIILLGAGCLCTAMAQNSPLAPRVLVLVNDNAGDGVAVGQYYANKRGIPPGNVIHVKTSTDESMAYSDYQSQIDAPVRKFLEANGGAMRHQILYIVPVYGIPLKVVVPNPKGGTQTLALDSVLAGMYAQPGPDQVFSFANPYCSSVEQHCVGTDIGARPPHFDTWSDQRDASGSGWKMFLVSRLDGPSAAIAQGLVDMAIAAEPSLTYGSGTGYFDYQGTHTPADGAYYAADQDMLNAANLSKSRGFTTVLNTQANATCRLMFHPASMYYYDPSAKNNLYVASYGAQSTTTRIFSAIPGGDIVIGVHGNTNNTGNFAYITLGTADPKTYIKLTYPLAPFTNWNTSDQIVLAKVVAGQTIQATMAVDNTMQTALDGVTEFRIHVENGVVSVLRNGAALISVSDPNAAPITLTSLSIGSLCWDYILTNLQVSDPNGNVVFSDNFKANPAANYQWSLAPLQGQKTLWAWGWYGTSAYDTYRFVPGAIGAQLTSYTAGTIRKPVNSDPAVYSFLDKRWGANWVPRMLEEGVTGTWGAVDEPYAQYYTSGTDFFNRFWTGYNFGESFYLAQNLLRWTLVAVGDPLYAPAVFQKTGGAIKRVVNAASYQDGPVSPGEVVAILGDSLGPAGGAYGQLTAGALARDLSGTKVWFDSTAAPLLYAGPGQINAIVPYTVAGQPTTKLQVEVNGVSSDEFTVAVAATAPGLLSADASGAGEGAILNQDYTPNSPANPAAKGSIVMLFGTGEGGTDPPQTEGTMTNGVVHLTSAATVNVGGVDGAPQFAGEAPGQLAGLFQVNAVIPNGSPSGPAVPVVVRIGGNATQAGITVAVQ